MVRCKRVGCWVASPLATAMVVTLTSACTPAKSEEEEIKEVVAAIPWMLEVYQSCVAYKATKAEAKRGDLASATYNMIRRSNVKGARAIVDKVLPVGDAASPNEYMLQLIVGGKVKFTSQSGKRPVKKGTPSFATATKLEPGACVTFSASDIEPMSTFQRAKVCEHRYYAQLADIAPCGP